LNVKSCMETNDEPLLLDKWSLAKRNFVNMYTSFTRITILLDEVLKYDVAAKSWSYVVTNAEPLSVESSNLVQCDIFVNCLPSC
jgi:hypothetical protein